jgi:hypothetical protein
MLIEKNKYEKIIDIINELYTGKESKPYFYGKHIDIDNALIFVDTPREENAYHGSTFHFRCIKDICSIRGELVVKRDIEKDTSDKIKAHTCDIRNIHRYPERIKTTVSEKEEYRKESHIHFICKYKDYDSTIDIAKFLRGY